MLFRRVCASCTTSSNQDALECLNVMDSMVCYGTVPPESLNTFLVTLCCTVNLVDIFCQPSWKIMRNLLGTHLGHSGLLSMCKFMENTENVEDVLVIRGSVFFVGAVLWGTKKIRSLTYSPNAVLQSFRAVC